MSKAARRPGVILAVLILAVAAMWVLRRDDDLPGWVYPSLIGIVVVGMVLFALRAARAPSHERFVLDGEWSTSLSPAEALERIAEHWEAQGARVHRESGRLQVDLGSDLKLRLLSIHSRRGRMAFPSSLAIAAMAQDEGAVVRAHGRDNLGWYPLMHPDMAKVADERNKHLVGASRQLTMSSGEGVSPEHQIDTE